MSDTINNETSENQKTDDKVETADSAQSVPAVEPEKIAEAASPAPAADKPARIETREPSRERTERPRGRRGFYDSSERGDRESGPSDQGGPRMPRFKKKICIFCQDRNMAADYKRPDILERFITDRGKILPRRVTGTCSKHQRHVAREIKRARTIALLPFVEQ